MSAPRSDPLETIAALRQEIAQLSARVAELEAAEARSSEIQERITRLADIVESSDDAIIGKDLNGVVQSWNKGAQRVYGYTAEEMTGNPMSMLLPPDRPNEEDSILAQIRAGQRVDHFETERVRKDGRTVQVSLTISPIKDRGGRILGASHIARDVSQRRALEQHLRQTQKLESLGVLAGGIAHDFNNLLTGILGNATLAMDSLAAPDPNCRLLADVVKAAESAADLTRQLLAYAGKGRFVVQAVNLSDLIREIRGLIQSSISRTVEVRLELAEDLPAIEADIAQIQQVIMNLVINGAEAVGEGRNGTVVVRTYARQVDEREIENDSRTGHLKPGLYADLEVRDSGCGMDEATMARIFDPFFTTKFTGRGLGLAAVLGIVRAHQGALKVESVVGQGSVFRVLFPAFAGARHKLAIESAAGPLQGMETVLVVDDEEIVRKTARNALQMYGYTVLAARDGQEGVELFRKHKDQIDLVLLDYTMPVMGGEEALRRIKELQPDAKVLLSSGFNEVETVKRFSGQGLAGFIQKPYAASELIRRIRGALGE
ncbi:MAG: PAS domain S-box protein [Acidobacteriia bacterium]|nr:PAS domain S-box protein [Terriglobia bacterium]